MLDYRNPLTWKILVVDDEMVNITLASMAFASQGLAVLTASGGVEALEVFRAERPNLVITDLTMPGMRGWQLATAIKRECADVPVFALTAYPILDKSETLNGDFDDYLLKPLRPGTLIPDLQIRLEHWAGNHRAGQEQ